jgi:hypothetical protein
VDLRRSLDPLIALLFRFDRTELMFSAAEVSSCQSNLHSVRTRMIIYGSMCDRPGIPPFKSLF